MTPGLIISTVATVTKPKTLDEVREAVKSRSITDHDLLNRVIPDVAWLHLARALYAMERHIGNGNSGDYYILLEPALEALEFFILGGGPLSYRQGRKKKERISNSLRKAVFERDLYRCRRCETHLNLTVDHVVPESKGGPTELDNLQTLCFSCNSSKCDRMEAPR